MWIQCMTQVTMSRQGGKRTCGRSFFETDGARVNVEKTMALRRSWGKCEVFHCVFLKEYSLWNFPFFAPGEGCFCTAVCFWMWNKFTKFTSEATRGDKCLDKMGITGDNLSHECQMRFMMMFSILCQAMFGCLVVLQVSAVSSFCPAFTCSSFYRNFSDFRWIRGIQSDLIFLLKCKRLMEIFFCNIVCDWFDWFST